MKNRTEGDFKRSCSERRIGKRIERKERIALKVKKQLVTDEINKWLVLANIG